MTKRYQIIRQRARDGKEAKWEFVAHGARYDKEGAERSAEQIRANGDKARIIAC